MLLFLVRIGVRVHVALTCAYRLGVRVALACAYRLGARVARVHMHRPGACTEVHPSRRVRSLFMFFFM